MSSIINDNSAHQPEDSNEVNNNEQTNRIFLRNPTIGDYFRNNEDARNKGHVDATKSHGTVRLVALNVRGCSPTNVRKINHLKDAAMKYDMDGLLLNEVNAKWNTANIS